MQSKSELRKEILQKRRSMSAALRDKSSAEILLLLRADQRYAQSAIVMVYLPLVEEVQILEEVRRLLGFCTLVAPRIENDLIVPVKLESLTDIRPGSFSVPEPTGTELVQKEQIDTILVPGLAFDRQGNRLGFGKGHYDRFLKDYKGYTIGLGFSFQIFDRIPADEWDVPMSTVISDQ